MSAFVPEKLALIPPMLQNVVDAGDLSGFVTLIFHKGEIVQVNTIGHRDIATKAPMTRDTLFRIASMTKPVTSVAALMLMEEGKLRLDDPITKWLPEFADMRVLKKADGPLDDTYPAPRAITIEDLFTHRSGLSYAFSAIGPIAKAYDKALGDVAEQQPFARRMAESACGSAASLSAGRALPLQRTRPTCWASSSAASRRSRSATC